MTTGYRLLHSKFDGHEVYSVGQVSYGEDGSVLGYVRDVAATGATPAMVESELMAMLAGARLEPLEVKAAHSDLHRGADRLTEAERVLVDAVASFEGAVTVRQLCDALHRTPSRVNQLVRALEKSGWLEVGREGHRLAITVARRG